MSIDDKQLDRWLDDAKEIDIPMGTQARYMRGIEEKLNKSDARPWFVLRGSWAMAASFALLLMTIGGAWAFPSVRSFVRQALSASSSGPQVQKSSSAVKSPDSTELLAPSFELDAAIPDTAQILEDVDDIAVDAKETIDAGKEPVRRRRRVRPTAQTSGDALSREADAHQLALASRGQNNKKALKQWKSNRRAFPKGALRHETDFHIIEMLVELERYSEARREAKRFLRWYPKSPKAKQVRQTIDRISSQ